MVGNKTMIVSILITIIVLSSSFLSGYAINAFFKKKQISKLASLVLGFLLNCSIFQLTHLPAMLQQFSWDAMLVWNTSIFLISIFILNIYGLKAVFKDFKKGIFTFSVSNVVILYFAISLIFIVFNLQFGFTNDDNNVYVSRILANINATQLDATFPGNGLPGTELQFLYRINGYELFLSFLSWLTQTKPSVMFSFIMPMMIIPINFAVVLYVSRLILNNKNQSILLALGFWVVSFLGFAHPLIGWHQFGIPFVGKSMYHNSLSLLLITLLARLITKERVTVHDWLIFTALHLTGIFFTPTSLSFSVVIYAIFVLIATIKYNFNIKKVFWFGFTGATLIVLALSSAILRSSDGSIQISSVYSSGFSFFDYFVNTEFFFNIFTIVSLILAVIYFKKYKLKDMRGLIFGAFPVLLFLIIINPVSANLYAYHIAYEDIFWRLYWLMPINLGIAYGFVHLFELAVETFENEKKIPLIVKMFVFAGIVVVGLNLFNVQNAQSYAQTQNYANNPIENPYKIPINIVAFAEFYTSLPLETSKDNEETIFTDKEFGDFLPNLVSTLDILTGRETGEYKKVVGEDYPYLMNAKYRLAMQNEDSQNLFNMILKYKPNYVVTKFEDSQVHDFLSEQGYEIVFENSVNKIFYKK